MIKVDKEGVPRIVQKVEYFYSDYLFKVTLFNGDKYRIRPPALIRYPPSFFDEIHINKEQLADAYIAAERVGMNYD